MSINPALLLPFIQIKWLTLFIIQSSKPSMTKGRNFSQSSNPYTRYCFSSIESLLRIIYVIKMIDILNGLKWSYLNSLNAIKWLIYDYLLLFIDLLCMKNIFLDRDCLLLVCNLNQVINWFFGHVLFNIYLKTQNFCFQTFFTNVLQVSAKSQKLYLNKRL